MLNHKELLGLMGTQVVVNKELIRCLKSGSQNYVTAYWDTKIIPSRTGWVVGVRWVLEGYTVPGNRGYGYDHYGYPYEYESPYFAETGRIKCLLVSFWPTEKPVYVPLDGFWVPEHYGFAPEPYCSSAPTIAERLLQSEIMKKEAKDIPRDAKGRFISNAKR